MSIDLVDIRSFIKDVKQAFYDKEKELNDLTRYEILKGVVMLRIEETKLMGDLEK